MWMPDPFVAALATPGLPWLMLAIGVAGIVRGFSGFGTNELGLRFRQISEHFRKRRWGRNVHGVPQRLVSGHRRAGIVQALVSQLRIGRRAQACFITT